MKNSQNTSNDDIRKAAHEKQGVKPVNWRSITLAVLVAATVGLIAANQVGIFAF